MFRILKFSLIVFGIVCTTACPMPSYTEIFTGNDRGFPELKGAGYKVNFRNVHHFRYNGQKIIFFDMDVSNTSGDTLTMISARSVIHSKTDTFSWRKPDEGFKDYYFYNDIKDTVILAPNGLARVYMLLVGKKNYSHRLYTRSNKQDTLYLTMNLFDKDTLQVPMRNHWRAGALNSY